MFKLLYGLTTSMAEQGGDIWSPTAARTLKSHVGQRIYAALSAALAHLNRSEELANGQRGSDSLPNISQDWVVQLLFDVFFFETVLSASTKSSETSIEGLSELTQTLDKMSGMAEQLRERLRKATQEYWKRTYLLFSFLA
jgi:hypothetical protein